MQCPKCRREIIGDIAPSEIVFCPYCGENFNQTDSYLFCYSCGNKLPDGSDYCPICGKGLKPASRSASAESQTQPETRLPSREDIAELVRNDTSSLINKERFIAANVTESENPAKKTTPHSQSNKAAKTLRDLFSGQWRLRGLYQKWARDGVLPPEEIPSTEALSKAKRESRPQQYEQGRLVLIIVAGLMFIAFFVFIGITMSRC